MASTTPLGGGTQGSADYTTKLDGILYHFYAKTSSIITHNRFTHIKERSASQEQQQQGSSAGTEWAATQPMGTRKPGRWFVLEVEDSDIFKEEIRLWRNVSSFLPLATGENLEKAAGSSTAAQSPVPSLVLDIVLDPSSMTPEQYLAIEEEETDKFGRVSVRRRRIALNNEDRKDADRSKDQGRDEIRDAATPIVLETWRIDFSPRRVDDSPELSGLYKSCSVHFRELLGVVKSLPVYRLRQKLRKEHAEPEPVGNADILKIGARLAVDHSTAVEDGYIGLGERMGEAIERGSLSEVVPASRSFAPIVTPIGHLATTVEYRANVNFLVEDTRMVEGLQDAALDSDYFSPGGTHHGARAQGTLFTETEPRREIKASERKKSLLSTLSHEYRQPSPALAPSAQARESSGIASDGAAASMTGKGNPSVSPLAPVQTSGRPVAGLANLRSIPSAPTYGINAAALPTTSTTGPLAGAVAGSSPASSTLPGSEAAFLTHGRKSSANERRIRPISGSSSGDNPPSPTTHSPLLSRPILNRATVSSHPRIGSYSPSSPSPLAQQLYAQQNAIVGSGGSRLSSSPSYRMTLQATTTSSISPSLRSVFQAGTPSVSHASISSLSKSPPKDLTEIKEGSASSSLSGQRMAQRQADSSERQQQNLEGAAQGTTLSSVQERLPSVAPQLIKRYSSNFSYRHGRHGASTESDASDGGNSFNAPYSKSWQARIEQRQAFAARSLGRDERQSYARFDAAPLVSSKNISPQSLHRPSFGAISQSQEDELHDLIRMFESRESLMAGADDHPPSGKISLGGRRSSGDNKVYQSSGEGSFSDAVRGFRNSTDIIARDATSAQDTKARMHPFSPDAFFTRGHSLNRSQVDDLLSKMQHSVRGFEVSLSSVAHRGSPSSGGAATLSSSGTRSQTDYPAGPQSTSPLATRSPLSQAAVVNAGGSERGEQQVSSGYRSRQSKSPLEDAPEDNSSDSASRIDAKRRHKNFEALYTLPPRPVTHRSILSRDRQVETDVDDIDDSQGDHDSRHEERLSRSHPGRDASRSSIELHVPGGPHLYDPLDDETAGRLELASEDASSERPVALSGRMGATRLGSMQSSHAMADAAFSKRNRPHRATLSRPYGGRGVEMGPGAAISGGSSSAGDTDSDRNQPEAGYLGGHTVASGSQRGHTHTIGTTIPGRPLHHTHSMHTQAHGAYGQPQTRVSLSPWRQRGFHPPLATPTVAPSGTSTSIGDDRSSLPSEYGPSGNEEEVQDDDSKE